MAGDVTLARLTAYMSMDNTRFKKGLRDSNKSLNSFQNNVRKLGAAIGVAFGVSQVLRFAQSALHAASVQAKAEAQLLVALKGRRDVQQSLIQQAKELQGRTLFGDEETIRAQALIAAFVKEGDAIKQIIPLVQDLAAAKGMQLSAAADLVAKTLGSSTNAMSRYGIQVTGAVGSTERLNTLTNSLADAFGGVAEAMAGADYEFTQLKNRMGDIKESIGGGVNTSLIGLFNVLEMWVNPQLAITRKEVEAINKELNDEAWKKMQMQGVEERMGRLSALSGQMHPYQYPAILKPPPVPIVPESVWNGWDKFATKTEKVIDPAIDHLNSTITKFINEGLMEMWDELEDETFPALEKVKNEFVDAEKAAKELNTMVGIALISSFGNLGVAIAGALGGAEDAMKELGMEIANNLGNILMMAGVKSGQWWMVIAGAIIQLGTGLVTTLGKDKVNSSSYTGGGYSRNIQFSVSGRDLKAVLDRNSDYNSFA